MKAAFTHLLDTNIVSDLINRGQTSRAVEPLRDIGAGVCTSLIVVSEVRYGVVKKGSASLKERAQAILALLPLCPFAEPVDRHYADIRVALERSGTPIGPNDLFIAAQCRAYGLRLVTANVAEFTRVPGLAIENWLTGVAS